MRTIPAALCIFEAVASPADVWVKEVRVKRAGAKKP